MGIEEDEVEYHMAKVVPGTYSISDFGRFVVDFKAIDQEGNVRAVLFNEEVAEGQQSIQIDTSELNDRQYLYRITTPTGQETKRILLEN